MMDFVCGRTGVPGLSGFFHISFLGGGETRAVRLRGVPRARVEMRAAMLISSVRMVPVRARACRMEARVPGGEVRVLPGGGRLWVQPLDPPHDQPGGVVVGLPAGGERRIADLGHLGVKDPPMLLLVEDCFGYLIGVQAS
ncbi:hypothetical protein [Georgenia ruanii]|uniref:hypothetical protein n=1 Tax=Georgenia ruanii TaxID=348442 RepID=UPI0012641780|nr:hypothetical protein [Georgenia ruanii]